MVLAAGADEATAGVRSFRASADTYVDAGNPDRAFGRRPSLHASPARRRAYVRFRIRGLDGGIARATLVVRSLGRAGALFEVRRAAGGSWNEQRLTFRQAPRVPRASPRARARAIRGWTRVDVTRLVGAGGVVTFVFAPRSPGANLVLRSRESGAAALLRVETDAPRGAPSPTGAAPTRAPQSPPMGTSPATNPYRGRVGMAGATVWYSEEKQFAYLRRLREAGMTWVREDFHWGAFERRPGVWDWTVGDRLMRNASRTGIDVLGVIAYSADWAASGPTIYHPPRDPNEYAAFCRALVNRYGQGGAFWRENPTLAPRPLRAVEIWNEPWFHEFWRPNPDPAAYVRLVRAAATAIRAVHPEVKILASADVFQMRADTSQSLDWFRLLLENDPSLFRSLVDAYSVHLYTEERSPLDTATAQRWRFDRAFITRDLAAAAHASHPLWVTEFGWTTEAGNDDAVSEATQALYTRQALETALTHWSGLAEQVFLYYWGDPVDSYVAGYSPLRPDGTPKPLWETLAALLR
ncbi:MAG TPA: DNRLRE domain-containing protein [Gaiellaceae bacterium]|nr:DNRLRE domain-containing protein [Gaiellaceae bacterium]